MTEPTRYLVSSPEEVWVRACNKFFERNGSFDWYLISKETAFHEIMTYTAGHANPIDIKQRIENLYKGAGVR
jgi:hypothetical protein